jgi:hypothetical protein
MATRTLQQSFNGGEVTPEFFGRLDDPKYHSGAATMRNFIALPHGPAVNRAGFGFVREVKTSSAKTRLIPFSYSTTQTMVIELGAGYFRFHTAGATLLSGGSPYELANVYAAADLMDIHYTQSADVLTLTHPNYPVYELRRTSATVWTFVAVDFTPYVTPPGSIITVSSDSGKQYEYTYKVTAIANDGINESLPTVGGMVNNNIFVTGAKNTMYWGGEPYVSTRAYVVGNVCTSGGVTYFCYLATTGNAPPNGTYWYVITYTYPAAYNGATAYVVNDTCLLNGITYCNKLACTGQTPPNDTYWYVYPTGVFSPWVLGNAYVVGNLVRFEGKDYFCIANNSIYIPSLYPGYWYPLTYTVNASGHSRYRIYKSSQGTYGIVGDVDATVLSFTDDNIAADISAAPPTWVNPFGSAGNYPAAVGYYEQRKVFAGTTNLPQNTWLTKTATEANLSTTIPSRDDNSLSFKIAAREANTIRHVVPLNNLVLLTSSAEWVIGSNQSGALTPSTLSAKPQSYIGANNAQPVIVNTNLLFASARGGHVREMAYSFQVNGYATGDISLRAPHLFDGLDIVDMAYSKSPYPLCWFVSSNGKLLGLSYVPEQQVSAWHWHDTNQTTTSGYFESICVVAEGNEDVLYAVVKRTIGGATKRYVERMNTRAFTDKEDAFFVDSGLTYDSTPATTFTGLTHLNGETVSILADGAVHPQKVVSGGSVTLDQAASVVHIGLPIIADLETLPVAIGLRDGSMGQGRAKNVNKAWLRVYRSSGIFIGPDANNLVEAKIRTTEVYGSPPNLQTDEIEVVMNPTWAQGGQVFVRQSDPLPLTIVSLTAEIQMGG